VHFLEHFLNARGERWPVGVAGLQLLGDKALLRSVAVIASYRPQRRWRSPGARRGAARAGCRDARSFDRSIRHFTVSRGVGGSRRAAARQTNNRRAKYYELTRKGRARLDAQTAARRTMAATVGQVVETVRPRRSRGDSMGFARRSRPSNVSMWTGAVYERQEHLQPRDTELAAPVYEAALG
jgi:hypothetical protein